MSYAYFVSVEHVQVTGKTLAGEPLSSRKLIGLFSTSRAAEAAIAQVREAPGFRDAPDGFCMDRVCVNLPDGVTKGKVRVLFRACHEYWNEAEQCDVWTEGPLHVIRASAEADLTNLRRNPQLAAFPDGFELAEIVVGQVQWKEGFRPFEA